MNNMPSALWRTEAPWRADHSVCAEPPRCRRIQPGSQLWLGSSVVPGVLGSLPAGAPRGALRWPHTLSAWSSFCQGQLWARGLLDSPPPLSLSVWPTRPRLKPLPTPQGSSQRPCEASSPLSTASTLFPAASTPPDPPQEASASCLLPTPQPTMSLCNRSFIS